MSVESILTALAQNASDAQLRRGAIYGGIVQSAAAVPGAIVDDREKQALLARSQAVEAEKLGFARNADTRAQQDQAAQNTATTLAAQKQGALKAGIAAGFGSSSDPKDFDESKAIKAVTDAGFPDLAPVISETHRNLLPKLTSGAAGSVMRDQAGQVVPGSAVPEKKEDYTINGQRFSGVDNTPLGDAVPTQAAPKSYQKSSVMLDGKPAEILTDPTPGGKVYDLSGNAIDNAASRVKPIPPASVQVNTGLTGDRPASPAEKAMANYMLPPISPRSMATPAGKAMMDHILAENPGYDASQYSVRAPTRKAFTTGPQGQQITSMNTAIEHLDQLQAAADALKNGDFKPGNAAFNYLKDTFGSGAPTSFATIKEKVDKELDAVASKGVPTVSGAAAQKQIGGVNSSPESVKAYIDTSIGLVGSSLHALDYQYHQAMGPQDNFAPLTPKAQEILAKRGFDKTGTPQAAQTAAPTLAAPPAGRVRIVGPNGQSGTILATDAVPPGWTKQP